MEDVIRITPRIVNLNIAAPDRRAARLMLIRWAKKLRNWLIEAGSPVKD